MRRTFGTSIVIALAMIGASATRASAQCPVGLTGPFCIDGDDNTLHHPTSGVAGQTNASDPLSASGVKELSPTNGNIYKLFNINYATPPGVLNLLSMPDKVDLVNVATQSAVDSSTGHLWFYFAWTRSTTNGSGFITIELEKNALNTTNCNYGAVTDFTDAKDPGVIALKATCNPWAGRRDNDLLISWNQVGNSNLTLYVQHFCEIGSIRPDCQGIALPSWGAATATFPTTAKAEFCDPSGNSFCGEAAIDLTALQGGESCSTFANIIPNTVTGNTLDFQATSDYKDTVFFNFPPVSNCGTLTVTKRLIDASGNTMTDANATFGYKVDRADGSKIRYDLNVADAATCTATPTADHCVDGPITQANPHQVQIVRPNSFGGVALHGGDTQVHTDLIPATNYRLVETSISNTASYSFVKAVCMDSAPTNATTLAAAATAAATSLSVPNGNSIVTGDYIIIDAEKILVTAGGGTATLTVERGQLGTTAAAHASGAQVKTLAQKTVSAVFNVSSSNFEIAVPVSGAYQQTDCVITNTFVKGNSTVGTQQRAKVYDSASISLDNALGANDTAGNVVIKLYTGATCDTGGTLLATKTVTFQKGDITGTSISVNTSDADFATSQNQATAGTNGASQTTVFSWFASYAGDAKNKSGDSGCVETTSVTIKDK